LEGKAEIVVDEVPTFLQNDDAMIIPGDTIYTIEANEKFKMLYIILNNKT
ncbi:MAG: cupin, partial [Aquimarina sp.]|nr:cupin [Aquimarina sp.]